MSGHSKWASIKHKKAVVDARRGKMFTRLIREIMLAARSGGGNPDSNPSLRMAIERARDVNMPADNIKRAISKGTGEDGGLEIEEIGYEGYGPAGVAVKVEVVTDNRRRAAGEVRSVFTKNNGSLGEVGCVSWIFERKGQLVIDREAADEEALFGFAIEAGADDVVSEPGEFKVYTPPEQLEEVRRVLEENGIKPRTVGFTFVPKTTVNVEGKEAEQLLKLLDALEDLDDVQAVYANFEMSDELMSRLESGG